MSLRSTRKWRKLAKEHSGESVLSICVKIINMFSSQGSVQSQGEEKQQKVCGHEEGSHGSRKGRGEKQGRILKVSPTNSLFIVVSYHCPQRDQNTTAAQARKRREPHRNMSYKGHCRQQSSFYILPGI